LGRARVHEFGVDRGIAKRLIAGASAREDSK
jgi:hypothetical protein